MVSVLLANIPDHLCIGRKFEMSIVECVYRKHYKAMQKIQLAYNLLDELQETTEFADTEKAKIKQLISLHKKIAWLNAYLKVIYRRADFSLPENCTICKREMRKNIKWLFQRGEKSRKKIRIRINEALVTSLRLYDLNMI